MPELKPRQNPLKEDDRFNKGTIKTEVFLKDKKQFN